MLVTHMGNLRHSHSTTRQQWGGRGGGQDSAQAVRPSTTPCPAAATFPCRLGCGSELDVAVQSLAGQCCVSRVLEGRCPLSGG